jgi:cobalt/nickel transport system ATP-binding protein
MTTALIIEDLTFYYPGQNPVIDGINLTVKSGETVGLIGPNGAGKTTLFLLLSGVVSPVAGKIEVFSQPVQERSFMPDIGMIFQHTADQLICPSVREDLAFGPQNMGLAPDEVERRVREAADQTGTTALLDRPPHHLSGGEQRLVALAGILAMEPRLLIMDEPTSDLDLRYRRRLINLLGDMTDKTLLIASHDLEFILETCSRTVLLEGGLIRADGSPVEVMGNKDLMEKHGLEVPHSLSASWHQHNR